MPSFQYQSLTNDGDARSGVIAALDRADAVRQLKARDEVPTSIDAVQDDDPGSGSATMAASAGKRPGDLSGFRRSFSFAPQRPSLPRPELANLVRELATALEAGLPLMQALRTVRRSASGRALPVILDHLIERVEAGDPLYSAAKDYGPPFDEMVVGMLRAADASGEMSSVMHQLADLLERSVELRREVLGATFYPGIVFCLLIASVVILVTVLVPRLIGPMQQSGNAVELPMPTLIVLGFADFVRSWWYLCIAAIVLAWVGSVFWLSIPANRYRFDRLKLQLPLLGRLLRDVAVARFTRTLGTLSSSGLPLLDALRITKNTLGNTALMHAVDEVQDQVSSGKSLADPLERSGLFPPLLVQVVNLGEKSGRLDSMLMHAAGAFDRRVNMSLKLFTKALPPVLLVIMASLGGFVLAAILLPMIQLSSGMQ